MGKAGLGLLGNTGSQIRDLWNTLTKKDTGGAEAYTAMASFAVSNKAQSAILTRTFTDTSKTEFIGQQIGSTAAKWVGYVKTGIDIGIFTSQAGQCALHDSGVLQGW